MKLESLNWDSEFFEIKVGRIVFNNSESDLKKLLDEAKKQNYQLLYVFTDKNTMLSSEILNQWNGKLVDRKVVYKKEVSTNIKKDKFVFPYDDTSVNDDLLGLAYLSGQYSRFRLDKNFPKGSFERMYKEWLVKSVNGELADEVFVAKEADRIVGFVTLKVNNNNGNIGLIAIGENAQGKGLGTQLINVCENYLNKCSVETLTVPTQLDNLQACKFYKKYGFEEDSVINIYHFWI